MDTSSILSVSNTGGKPLINESAYILHFSINTEVKGLIIQKRKILSLVNMNDKLLQFRCMQWILFNDQIYLIGTTINGTLIIRIIVIISQTLPIRIIDNNSSL